MKRSSKKGYSLNKQGKQKKSVNIYLKSKKKLVLVAIIAIGILIITGCTAPSKARREGDKLTIVTTTTILHDLARTIVGDEMECIALMGAGVDPHLYKASAGDVDKLIRADMIVYNGLHLEGQMVEVFSKLDKDGKFIACIGEHVDGEKLISSIKNIDIGKESRSSITGKSVGDEQQQKAKAYDPHIWYDVEIWSQAAVYLLEEIIRLDPENEAIYTANLDCYLQELTSLDEYIRARTLEIPEGQRVIITAHDAFRYMGIAYGYEVRGLQGISTESESSTADISDLATYITKKNIKAIFVESSIPTKNIEALQEAVKAKGHKVVIGGELYSDSLGDIGSGHDSYISTFKANVDTIVDSLK